MTEKRRRQQKKSVIKPNPEVRKNWITFSTTATLEAKSWHKPKTIFMHISHGSNEDRCVKATNLCPSNLDTAQFIYK